MSTCRSCGAEIEWVVTASGKRMPVNVERDDDGMPVSHFVTCPDADEWRQRQ